MRFQPLQMSLRDGRGALLREATAADAGALLALERAIVRARQGVVKHEDELPADVATYAAQREGVGLHRTDGTAFPLVVVGEGGALLGEASVLRLRYRMVRHVGMLGIGVHPEAQGLGVGRALMEHLLAWVRAHRDANGERVLRVELNVRADNPRAIALYRSLGFVHEGLRTAFVRGDDGTYVDDHVMALRLDSAAAT